jgi:hypothetical protein
MGFERQEHQAHCCAVTLERHIEALRLNGERSLIVVRVAMNQQDGCLALNSRRRLSRSEVFVGRPAHSTIIFVY